MIFLMHKQHGRKIAYSDPEADHDARHGWIEVDEDTFYGKKVKYEEKQVERKKPGPKPKDKLLQEVNDNVNDSE